VGCCPQLKCSFLQLDSVGIRDKSEAVKLVRTFVEKGPRKPAPLKVPEGTGGGGCSAEVAAKAEALHAALHSSSEAASTGTSSADRAAGGGTDASPAPVECAVCHRKPGDPGVPATLKLCGGCQGVRYCSAECQKKDWKMGHKSVCQMIQKMSQAEMLNDTDQQASSN
jgi:hypothetical protein